MKFRLLIVALEAFTDRCPPQASHVSSSTICLPRVHLTTPNVLQGNSRDVLGVGTSALFTQTLFTQLTTLAPLLLHLTHSCSFFKIQFKGTPSRRAFHVCLNLRLLFWVSINSYVFASSELSHLHYFSSFIHFKLKIKGTQENT